MSCGRSRVLAVAGAVVLFACPARGADPGSQPEAPKCQAEADQVKATLGSEPPHFDLAHPPSVRVENLQLWLTCRKAHAQDLRIFFNGRELESVSPWQMPNDKSAVVYRFSLKHVKREEPTWKALLEERKSATVSVDAELGLGLHGDKSPAAHVASICLTIVNRNLLYVAGLGMLAVLGLLYYLARYTGMLRDDVSETEPRRRPYSLARVQMAGWTVLVLGGTIFVSLVQWRITDIPAGLLGLIGISAGTFLAAQIVTPDASRSASSRGRGLVQDLLADRSGAITLHRFQIVVWTIATACMFIVETAGKLAMPELPANLLGLMGISNGVYLGVKYQEKPKP